MSASYEGVLDFYLDRLRACPLYGFTAGQELLHVIHSCAYYDAGRDFLTPEEFSIIIKSCQETYIKLMEDNYNDGWHE